MQMSNNQLPWSDPRANQSLPMPRFYGGLPSVSPRVVLLLIHFVHWVHSRRFAESL